MRKEFLIDIHRELIDDLRARLANTRWPDEIEGSDWSYGTSLPYLKNLCDYWQHEFDWPSQQKTLNSLPHFLATIENNQLHFIHIKGAGDQPVPLLLIHGYPDSFVRFLKLIPLLEKEKIGLSFDLIIPSIPGFGFSGVPTKPGMGPKKIAELFYQLVKNELGYESFFVHGGDWGSAISEQLVLAHPESVRGLHLTDIPFLRLFDIPPGELSEPEKKYLQAGQQWQQKEGGYAMIQSTKPQSLAYGLTDSPAGLAGWIIQMFYSWSDNRGELESSFTRDELLTNLTIYWCTGTINSGMRIYYEMQKSIQSLAKGKVTVPTGAAIFPKDLIPAPVEYAKRFYNVVHWTNMPRGGHFAAMEEPDLLAGDIRGFVLKVISGSH